MYRLMKFFIFFRLNSLNHDRNKTSIRGLFLSHRRWLNEKTTFVHVWEIYDDFGITGRALARAGLVVTINTEPKRIIARHGFESDIKYFCFNVS